MKLFDQNTSEIVAAAAAVLEGKVDEAALSAKKKLKEVEEPEAQGEKDFKAKHAVKKVGRTGEDDDVTVDEEQDVCESCGKVHEGACSEELDEVTIHVTEAKLKAGRGNAKIDVDYIGDSAEAKASEKKFKIKIAVGRNDDAIITGEKKNIIAYLQSDYYGMDDQDIEELFPELMESLTEAKIKEESDKQKKYQAFFQKALKKFGVDSPQDLEKDKRAEFFDYVDANYEADNETD